MELQTPCPVARQVLAQSPDQYVAPQKPFVDRIRYRESHCSEYSVSPKKICHSSAEHGAVKTRKGLKVGLSATLLLLLLTTNSPSILTLTLLLAGPNIAL